MQSFARRLHGNAKLAESTLRVTGVLDPSYCLAMGSFILHRLAVQHRADILRQTSVHTHTHTYGLFRVGKSAKTHVKAHGEHVEKPDTESNPEPSCCEAAVLAATPPWRSVQHTSFFTAFFQLLMSFTL